MYCASADHSESKLVPLPVGRRNGTQHLNPVELITSIGTNPRLMTLSRRFARVASVPTASAAPHPTAMRPKDLIMTCVHVCVTQSALHVHESAWECMPEAPVTTNTTSKSTTMVVVCVDFVVNWRLVKCRLDSILPRPFFSNQHLPPIT